MTSPRGASPRSPRGSSPAQSPRDSPRGDSPRGDSPRGASPRGRRQSARGRNSVHEDSPRWANRPRRRPCAGRSNSSLLADVVVKNDEIEALKESLQRGGGVVARKTVGEFLKGFRLAAGQDLKLEAFDITGLKDGEEVDPRLASVVQDSLAGSREDDRDIRLYARPPWYEPEDAVPLSRCQQFWSRWLPCLRKPKRWRRKRHLGEGLFGCYVRVQQALLRLVYRKSSAAKQRDIFVSFQEADRDLARWLRLFCDMRSLSAYAQLPNEAARKSLEKKPQEPQEPQNSRSSLRGSIRGSMRGSIRGSIRRSIASMSSVASQRTGDMDTGGPVEETAVPVEEQEVSLPQWLQDREELIRTSRVFLVITSQDSLENAAVWQDCIWAWQWGVPVLPVRRVGDNKLPKEVKKKLRFLHTLKMGLPEVGLGTNRKDFFFKVSSSLAAGIRMGRSRKRPKMPRHVWDFFFRAVKHLQRDSKDLQSTEASVSERPVLGLTTGEARFCIERGQLVDVPDLGRLEKPEKVKKEEGTGRHESKNQEELVAKDKTEQTELSAAMEDRTFGILTMLSLLGSQNFQVATKAAQVLRTITATERGAAAVALFGGVEVLLKLVAVAIEGSQEKKQASTKRNIFGRKAKDTPASPTSASPKSGRARDEVEQAKSARWGKETSPESARGPSSPRNRGAVGALDSPPESPRDSPKSARWRRGTSAQDSPPESPGRDSPRSARWQEDSPSQSPDSPKSARWRGVSPRDDASPRDASPRSPRARAEGPMSARGGRGGQESPREETDAKPNKLAKRRLPCLGRCRRRRHEEDVADEDDDEEDEEDGAGGGHHGHGKSGDSSNLFFRCADHGLAALRNLAAFSRERKEQILEKEGEKVTMEALRVCRGLTEAQQPARSASALLRNLSGGLRGAYALRGAGFLQIAEEELEDHRGGPGVRLHILAALQNMASCADASDNIFPQPQNWLELCALAARTAVEEGHFRTTKQALGAMANFAILRTAQEALQGHYCSDHGLPFAPFGHMLAAHPVEESSEEEAEQLDAADIKAKVESTTQESSGTSSDSDTAQESPDPGVQQSSKSHIADPEMEESLARASEKVPPEMIQSMLALIQVKALRPASGDVPSSLVSLASSAAAALANFAQDTDLERLLGSMGGIEMTIDALGLLDAEEFQLQAVRFLWNMTFSRANQQRFMDHDGLGKVLAAMQTFQKTHHSPLQEHGCGVLRNLAHGDARHKRALLRSGVIKAVCEALRKFYQEINVCTQAVFALTALCLGAPPAALQAKKYGALRWLVSALKLTGDNAEITELILQALEALLLVPQALTPFGRRKGHLEVLQVLDRFAEDTTVHMVFRTLAAALSHTNLKDMEMEKGEEPAPSGSEELWELMAKAPGTTIRNDLMDRGIIQKVIDALQKFEEYTIAIEAGAGVLMNVALEVKERDEDATNLQRKLDVGLACHKCLTIIGHLATSAEKMQSTGFVSNLFRLLAAVALHEEIALLLHRKQAASKALEYLKAYWDVPTVQASGCAFLSNLANSKLRIREAIVGVGTLEYLIDQLKGSKHQALIVQSMCKALKDLAPAEAAVQILRTYKLLDLVFEAADEHLEEPHVMEASLALLWTLSAIHRYAEELNRKGTTQRALQVLQRHRAHHEVCRCGAGLLRNLFAAPLSAKAADDCLASGGVRLLLEALWQHCLPPVQGTMSQAAYTMAKRGSMDSIGSSPGNGPKRAGSILEAGKAVPRAGSTLARDSQLEGANPRVTNRRNSVRRNSVRRVSDPDLSVKIFDLEAADRVTTEEKMAVAEQILAALKNLVAYSKLAAALAEEIYRSEEWDNLRMVVELYPKSIMVQYQGFELIGKLVTEKRELRAAFRAIADHVLLTNLNHRNTPVADVAELLLEALN